jgi:hypothetical protein
VLDEDAGLFHAAATVPRRPATETGQRNPTPPWFSVLLAAT